MSNNIPRPVMRYHGGKFRLAPWVISHFPPHRIYVEPFGGAGSVLIRKQRSFAEVYNDLDGDVVNVFKVLRDPDLAPVLRRQLELTPWSRTEFWNTYEPIEATEENMVERARRTIVRAAMAHGSSSRRKNRSGFRAKAFRQNQTVCQDWTTWPAALEGVTERLRGVVVECRPALEIIEQQDSPETLFYLDPPYVQSTRSSIRTPSDADRAYAHDMTDQDHRDLAAVIHRAKGMVVLSGYHCDLYESLYGDWIVVEKHAMADYAQKRTECLWLNPAAAWGLDAELPLLDERCPLHSRKSSHAEARAALDRNQTVTEDPNGEGK